MAYNETRVTICGNVASKVTHTKVGTGFSRAGFRLFTAERVWDREERAWNDGARMFLSVTCWRMLADNANASLNKGDPVVVTGRLMIKDVESEGVVRQVVEVEATAIGPNLALCTAAPARTRLVPDAVEARAAPEFEVPGVLAPVGGTPVGRTPVGVAPESTTRETTTPRGTAPVTAGQAVTAPRATTPEFVAPGFVAPGTVTPEIVAPRRGDEPPPSRPAGPAGPGESKEVAEVPF